MSGGARPERAAEARAVRRLTEQYQELRGELVALAKQVTADRDPAEDVVEKVFVRLLERIGGRRTLDANVVYLRAAVRRSALLWHRDRAKREDPSWSSAVVEESRPVPTPWEDLLAERRRAIIDQIQEQLTPGQKAVFDLVDLKGLSYNAAAEQIGTSRENVKQQLSRARRTLRAILTSRGRTSVDDV